MTCSITYPSAGGDGAVDGGGNLVSCCGEWHRPVGAGEVECKIYAKIYPATGPVDTDPIPGDPDFTSGTLLPSPYEESGTFHFNAGGISGAGTGGTYRIKIWITADDVHFEPFGPRSFDGCVYGDGDCDEPPCLGEVTVCADDNVIDQIAPAEYRVQPDQRTVELFRVAKEHRAGQLTFEPVSLVFSFADSSPSLAVWTASRFKEAPIVMRLEVKRGSCGCLVATLYLLQANKRVIEPATRWRSEEFNLLSGGVLEAISTKGAKVGGCLEVSVPPPKSQGRRGGAHEQ